MENASGRPAAAVAAGPHATAAGTAGGKGLVLEIGGGHNPYPESDVIVDKFLENKERGGDLKVDRPVVIADFQQLPFKDGSFNYAICSHVLEHVEDVPSALGELTRVAKAGYLETPSALNEMVEPHRDYHRWYVAKQGSRLLFYPKTRTPTPQQTLINRLLTGNVAFKLFYLSNPELAFTKLRWRGRIDYEVMPETAVLDLEKLYPRVGQGLSGMLAGIAKHYGGLVRRRLREKSRRGRAPADLLPILCCPVCKSSFRVEGDKLICATCAGWYRREGTIYRLLKEDLRPL